MLDVSDSPDRCPEVAAGEGIKRSPISRQSVRAPGPGPGGAPRIRINALSGRRVLQPDVHAVAEEIARVARGDVVTVSQLRVRLARRFDVDECSAAGTRRCLGKLAGDVAEDLHRGRPARWPIWRVTNDNGQLHGNWPLAARWRAAMLRDEGRVIRYLRANWAVG